VVNLCWKSQPGDSSDDRQSYPSGPERGFVVLRSPFIAGVDLDDRPGPVSSDSGASFLFRLRPDTHLELRRGAVGPSRSIAHYRDNPRRIPPPDYDSRMGSSTVLPDDSQGKHPAPPQRASSKGGWVGRSTDDARKTFKVATRKPCGT